MTPTIGQRRWNELPDDIATSWLQLCICNTKPRGDTWEAKGGVSL
jgi:hypothetical protein